MWNKDIKIKKQYIIIVLVINMLILGLYYTYAAFVTKQLQENVAVLETAGNGLIMTSPDLTDNSITVAGGATVNITINVKNTNGNAAFYYLLHEGVPTGVMVYATDNTTEYNNSFAVGHDIEYNATVTESITIANNTTNAVTVTFYCHNDYSKIKGYSYTNIDPNYDHSLAQVPTDVALNSINAIPVYYDPTSLTEGVWKKADVTNYTSSEYVWYDYDNGRWANIVLVSDTNRATYLNGPPGTTITNEDILAFFVWIPQFSYKVINYNNATSYENDIDVMFNPSGLQGSVDCYDDECYDFYTTSNKIYDNYSIYDHPGSGVWVGKFESSYSGGMVKIIPNVNSRMTNYRNSIIYAISMENENNPYGLGNSNYYPNLMSNRSWGAVAILSNSEYGKSGNTDYFTDDNTSFKKIYNNNNSMGITGCSSNYNISSKSFITTYASSCITYNNLTDYTHTSNTVNYPIGPVGPGASTTGTIYGIYDMAGGRSEIVNAIVVDEYGDSPVSTGYNADIYSYNDFVGTINDSSNIRYLYRYKLGDGIREHYRSFSDNGMWHGGYLKQDVKVGVMIRGGAYNEGHGASMFSTNIVESSVSNKYTYRIVLEYMPVYE